jgi:hypothetical protein
METEFLKRVTEHPELINITRSRESNGLVCYSEHINSTLIDSICWIYQNYFAKSIILFVPKIKNQTSKHVVATLEVLEQYTPKKNEIIIFAYFEFICKDIPKRRLVTLIKNIAKKNKVLLVSFTSLKYTNFPFLDTFEFHEMETTFYKNFLNNVSLFDLIDPLPENYNDNLESFIEFVSEFKNENKRVYLSLNLQPNKLLEIERLLKENDLSVSRKEEECDVVINSSKTTEKIFLNSYDVLIFAPPLFDDPIEFVCFFKEFSGEIFIDSSKIKNITQQLKLICTESFEKRLIVKDSADFETYNEIKKQVADFVMATDCYYNLSAPESLLKLDLSNLVKKDYDLIRTFVKNKLTIKYDIEIKTCQLAAPCSPRDRSKKLNSLSNKISSFDYRCDCTCEIFKDYTIGVVVWNDFFKNRKKINILKNNTFVYQTTKGTWKFTSVQ